MRKYKILLPSFWVTMGMLGIAAVTAMFRFSFQDFFFVSATSFLMLTLGGYIEKVSERKKPDWANVKYKMFIQSFAVGMLCSALGYFSKTFNSIFPCFIFLSCFTINSKVYISFNFSIFSFL